MPQSFGIRLLSAVCTIYDFKAAIVLIPRIKGTNHLRLLTVEMLKSSRVKVTVIKLGMIMEARCHLAWLVCGEH